jgi:hypothetical protein
MTRIELDATPASVAAPADRRRLLQRLARWMDRVRHPRLMLLVVVFALYAPSLLAPLMLEDYRNLRYMEEYRAGTRPRLGLYTFIRDGDHNAFLRARGEMPWWLPDDLYFAYYRPLAERCLYLEFLAFGRVTIGYHVVSVALFAIGVCLVLSLFRRWGVEEPIARWAALFFAVSACNTIPVTFVASQCDALALAALVTALMAATNYAEGRGLGWLLLGMVGYAAAILCKEAAVPACVLPLLLFLVPTAGSHGVRASGRARRVAIVAIAFVVMAAALVMYHVSARFGTNIPLILNPVRSPGEYLRVMPLNAAALLASWICAFNPAVLVLFGWERFLIVFVILGLMLLIPVIVWLRQRLARDRALLVFALWPLPFLPILACAVPDSRVMMLPCVGLSVVGAVWLAGSPRLEGSVWQRPPSLRLVPFLLLIVAQLCTSGASQITDFLVSRACDGNLRTAVDEFGRPARADDSIFFLNTRILADVFWPRDRLMQLAGPDCPHVAHLSHLPNVKPEVLGPRTLRLRAEDVPFFESPLGRGTMTRPVVPVGWTSRMKEFTAVVSEARDGHVTAVDFEFREPLDSPRYRFFIANITGPPEPWRPNR